MPVEFDVFLSHDSRDKPMVEEIGRRLESRGLHVWLDKWELRPGFPWQEGLEQGVLASKAGAVFVGMGGLGPWETPEMRAFIARSRREKVPVIPVLLPGCAESPPLTVFLEAYTWVDLRGGLNDEGLDRLFWGITGKKLGMDAGPGGKKARSPEEVKTTYGHVESLEARVKSFLRPARADLDFPVTLSISGSYDDLLSQKFSAPGLTASALLDHPDYSDVLIHSPGGFGKTKYLGLLVEEAIRRGWVPFYLDLKHGIGGIGEQLPAGFELKDLFESFSVAGGADEFTRALASGWLTMLLVDGLNELQRDKSNAIARLLDKLSRKEPRLRIITADRMTPYAGMDTFLRARIDPLPEPVIRSNLLPGTVLSEADLHLLSVPFFLDLRLKLVGSQAGDLHRAQMFDRYFSDIAGISTDTRRVLAKQAYEAYARFGSRTFERAWWTAALPQGVAAGLEEAGITVPTKPGANGAPRLVFRHQLLHDFLVGEELGGRQAEEWTGGVLDSATFRGNSIECLSFAGEFLGPRADELLESIYDWSYSAAIDTIADLERSVTPSPVSRDLLLVMIALNAEKRFDAFEGTAVGSERRVSALPPNATVQAFLKAANHAEVLDLVRAFSPTSEPFSEWRRVFLLSGAVSEGDLRTITSHPIIGWTAANSLRRCTLKSAQLAELRGILFGAANLGSLRWRVAHVLGAFPSKENVALLLELAQRDPELWVKYGATRSLFEIVSKPGSRFRKKVLGKLLERLPHLEDDVLIRQMRVSIFIRDAGPDWYRDVLELVEKASHLEPLAESEKAQWIQQLEQVKQLATHP